MEGTVPLSVVILAKNEAQRIRACIDSARWAEEVLVVDDESSDDTVAIAEAEGARVLRRKTDVEGRQRNWAYGQARHPWIFSLDADELFTPELANEIRDLFAQGTPAFQVYSVPRRNFIGSRWIRHGGWYPSGQVKLFDRSVFRWEETTVHPRALSNAPWSSLRSDLLHYSYRDLADFVGKMNRQTSLEAEKWVADRRPMSRGKAMRRAVDRFFRAYVGKRGYRDGFLGFVVAAMGGMYQFLAWAKYAETTRPVKVEELLEPFGDVARDEERYDRTLLMSHLSAYRLAGSYARGKRLLEIGCGRGYGAYYLSHLASAVTAVDVDPEVLDRARRLFRRSNLEYCQMDATRLAVPDRSVDVVGTFQVIEHIPTPQVEGFLQDIRRVLAPGGVAVLSTLNVEYNRKGNPHYQKADFHEHEFTGEEFSNLLRKVFPDATILGLYPTLPYRIYRRLKKWGMDRWGPSRWNPVARFYRTLRTEHHRICPGRIKGAIDLIGVCRVDAARPGGSP